MDKQCPRCGKWSSNEAIYCDCGYDFNNDCIVIKGKFRNTEIDLPEVNLRYKRYQEIRKQAIIKGLIIKSNYFFDTITINNIIEYSLFITEDGRLEYKQKLNILFSDLLHVVTCIVLTINLLGNGNYWMKGLLLLLCIMSIFEIAKRINIQRQLLPEIEQILSKFKYQVAQPGAAPDAATGGSAPPV